VPQGHLDERRPSPLGNQSNPVGKRAPLDELGDTGYETIRRDFVPLLLSELTRFGTQRDLCFVAASNFHEGIQERLAGL